MDFGIARSTEMGGTTQTGVLLGTPDYMSPEQVLGEHVDARSDLFTMGVIFYQLLTGDMPYKADTVQKSMFKRTRERPKPPNRSDPTVPKFLSDVVEKCLQIDVASALSKCARIARGPGSMARRYSEKKLVACTAQSVLVQPDLGRGSNGSCWPWHSPAVVIFALAASHFSRTAILEFR